MSPRLSLLVALATVACTGGGGALSQSLETQDEAPLSNDGVSSSTEGSGTREAPGNSTESAPQSTESPPSGGGFTCGGTYSCTINGQKSNDPLVLVPSGDGCVTTDNDKTIDASIVRNGKAVPGFSVTGNGFAYSTTITSKDKTTTINIACTKVSSDTTTTTPKKDSTTGSTRDAG